MVRDGRISFIRESIQGDKQTTATFRTSPEIMADVTAYDPKELLLILFNHVDNFLSLGSGWRFDSIQSLAISLFPARPTIRAGSFIDTSKSLYSKGILNIQNLKDDSVSYGAFSRIYTEYKHAYQLYNYPKYFNDLDSPDSISISSSRTHLTLKTETKQSTSTFSYTKITKFFHSTPPSTETGYIMYTY